MREIRPLGSAGEASTSDQAGSVMPLSRKRQQGKAPQRLPSQGSSLPTGPLLPFSIARLASEMGQPLSFVTGFFDLQSWSEVSQIPARPSVDRANGALCHIAGSWRRRLSTNTTNK